MFIDYNNIKNFIIEQLIYNNRSVINNLIKFNLYDVVLENIKKINNEIYVFDNKIDYISGNKEDILKQFIINDNNYKLLINFLLDFNCKQLSNKNIALLIKPYLTSVKKEDGKIEINMKNEVYYQDALLGMYESFRFMKDDNIDDFILLRKSINKAYNINSDDLLIQNMNIYNYRYKKAINDSILKNVNVIKKKR